MLKKNIFFYSVLITILIFILLIIIIKQRNIENFKILNVINGDKNFNRINIWKNIKDNYGEIEALKIFPKTFILPNEINELMNDKNKEYILKKLWGGERKNIDLFNNKKKIKKYYKNYDIAQVYIYNPILYNGFKFDIRFFMVVDCSKGIYLNIDGYNVYTKKKFKLNSIDKNEKINQFHTDESHYDINKLPRYFKEFCLKKKIISRDKILKKLRKKLKKLVDVSGNLCSNEDIFKNKKWIYGLDVELLENGEPIIIEINSRPVLNFTIEWKQQILYKIMEDVKNSNYKNGNWLKI